MLDLIELAALGFASYRVTQLIVWDSILDGWRLNIDVWRQAKDSRIRKFIWGLITCVYCTGWHASWLTVLTYRLATGQGIDGLKGFVLFGIESFAVAGIQALLNRWDDSRPGHEPEGH